MAFAGLSKQILNGDHAIGEDQWAGRGAADAKLMLFRADREPGRIALDQESGKLLAVDFREHDEKVGEAALEIHIFSPFRMYCLPSGKSRA